MAQWNRKRKLAELSYLSIVGTSKANMRESDVIELSKDTQSRVESSPLGESARYESKGCCATELRFVHLGVSTNK